MASLRVRRAADELNPTEMKRGEFEQSRTHNGLMANRSRCKRTRPRSRSSSHRWSMFKPSVQIHNVDGLLVAEFWNCLRLDPAPVQELHDRYEAHVKAGGRPEVVIDLEGVDFSGSAALGNFVALHRTARQHGGRLVFCKVEPTVAEVFRASKLERLFEFVADREAGIAAANRPPAAPSTAVEPPEIGDERPRPASPVSGGLSRLRRKKPASDPE